VLTALIHHCKSRDEFTAVGDLIVERFCAVGRRFGADSTSNLVEDEVRTGGARTADDDETMQIQGGGKEQALVSGKVECVRRVLEVVSVPCSVRQGSRMSRKFLLLLHAPSVLYIISYLPHRNRKTTISSRVRASRPPPQASRHPHTTIPRCSISRISTFEMHHSPLDSG
jgi:hypothetical protein